VYRRTSWPENPTTTGHQYDVMADRIICPPSQALTLQVVLHNVMARGQ
jgi:hypothetical protein